MPTLTRRQISYAVAAVAVVLILVIAFMPRAVPVEAATVTRGPLQVTVEEEGETRLERTHIVTASVPAYARPITLRVGDRVGAGQALVQLEAPRSMIYDPRSQAEAVARVAAARAALAQAEAAASQAAADLERQRRLFEAGATTRQALEHAETEARQAAAARNAARAELSASQAALARVSGQATRPVQEVLRSPIAGRVLAVHRESGGPVNPGESLMEIGNTERLEVAVNLLSQDAVRVTPGTRVLLTQWSGVVGAEGAAAPPIEAQVSHVEPRGFTRVSALGVEEQRVTVVVALPRPPVGIGPGYRVLARFVIWEGENVLQAPASALFRADTGWAAFVIEDDRARRRNVTAGYQAGLVTQVLGGLEEGETVLVQPGNEIEDGTRVDVQRR